MINPVRSAKLKKYPEGNIYQFYGENVALYLQAIGAKGHTGVDIATFEGDEILAAHNGTIVEVYNDANGYGHHVRIVSPKQLDNTHIETIYGHLSSNIPVKVGDEVKAADVIGYESNTGFVISGSTAYWGNAPAGKGCYDKETEILTNEGWKKFYELNEKELVATLNKETKKIEYQKPTAYVKFFYKKIKKFKNNNIDLAITDNHNLVVYAGDRRYKNSNNLKLTKLSEISSRISIPLKGVWDGVENEFFYLPSVIKLNHTAKYATDEIKIKMNDWLEFLGWFCSDGCWYNKKDKNGYFRYIVSISQSYSNKEKREKIEKCLKKLPFNYCITKGIKSGGVNFTIFNKQLCVYLEQFGKRETRIIPGFIETLSKRQINIFLNSFFKGDGYTSPEGTKQYYPGIAKKMADQLQILLFKIGSRGIIRTKKEKQNNFIVTEIKAERVSIKRSEIKEVEYNGFVYCVEVQNHILYVRRNGKPYWCGNTHLHFGLRILEDVRPNSAQVSYSGGKYNYSIINYTNGLFGYIDPMPFMQTFMYTLYKDPLKSSEIYAFSNGYKRHIANLYTIRKGKGKEWIYDNEENIPFANVTTFANTPEAEEICFLVPDSQV